MIADLISRQAAIDAVERAKTVRSADREIYCAKINAQMNIQLLPSAQLEIIHCKDCNNSEHWYRDRRRCFLWSEDGVSVFDDGFCNYAERITDG